MTEQSLITFLRARLDEDERYVREADESDGAEYLDLTALQMPLCYIRDIPAKRDLLEHFAYSVPLTGLPEPLRFLALPYARHRDYREEWRP